MSFIHLRVHTAYSLAEGAIRVKTLPKLCLDDQMPAVGITDTNNLFGALEIAMGAAASGIQPIIGMQIDVNLGDVIAPIIVLCQNDIGYQNLMQLTAQLYAPERTEMGVSLDVLKLYSDGIIALSGGDLGPIGALYLDEKHDAADDLIKNLHDIYNDRLYMEIMRHGLKSENETEEFFIEKALEYDIPLVATNNVFFENADMHEAHDALLCIAASRYVAEDDRRKVTPHHYFKSQKAMMDLFEDLPEAIHNTVVIARRCHFMPTPHKPILPPFESPSGLIEVDELERQALEGLEKRLVEEVYPLHPESAHGDLKKEYHERLQYELSVINKMGFPGYFLIVADFIQYAKSQNIPVGPGRGSGAGSLVAWSITITDIDPIRFSLIFERFLNPERVSMPDFDVDFCQDRRDEVIKYVVDKYGSEKVAHIITFGKLQAKAVIRDVGRVLQMPYGQVDRISKMIPNNPANPMTLTQALKEEDAFRQAYGDDDGVKHLVDLGIKLEGLYRHASTHAAGIVIGDRPLHELVPIYRDDKSPLSITQFTMKYVELAGLVKFDFLGLKTLTVIENAAKDVQKHDPDFLIRNISLEDKATFELLTATDTVGVFQVEGAGMKDVLGKMKPDRFEDVIALVALYRPGPMDDIPKYLARKHGLEDVEYLHPALEPILSPTYGVMVYQEQVMQIAQVLGGYTLGAADLLRRAMGKKIKEEMDAQRSLFTDGAKKFGVKDNIATLIFDQMAKFAGYGFNKCHSGPYALLSYQTAFLKANHPLEFYAATMTSDMANTDKLNIYKQDIERRGLELRSPDINKSFAIFTVEDESVRYALAGIKNVGEGPIELMIAERSKNGPFTSMMDFAKRVDSKVMNKRLMEQLIHSGAFDAFNSNRQQLFGSLDVILRENQMAQSAKKSRQNVLFADMGGGNDDTALKLVKTKDYPPLERLQKEFEALGFYLSAHPLDLYKKALKDLNITSALELQSLKDEATQESYALNFAGILVSKQERMSKAGKKFAFAQFSDASGVFEVALFGETYQNIREKLSTGTAFHLQCTLKIEPDGSRIFANTVSLLSEKTLTKDFVFDITAESDIDHMIEIINNMPDGPTQLYAIYHHTHDERIMLQFPHKKTISEGDSISLLSLKPL